MSSLVIDCFFEKADSISDAAYCVIRYLLDSLTPTASYHESQKQVKYFGNIDMHCRNTINWPAATRMKPFNFWNNETLANPLTKRTLYNKLTDN